MPTTVAAAIQAAFSQLPALQALLSSPQLWHIEDDFDGQLPYATFHTASAQRTLTTGPYVVDHVIQWSFHASTADEAEAIGQAFRQTWPLGFDRAPLIVNNQLVAAAQFEDDGFTTIGEGKGPGGQDCYQHITIYRVMKPTTRS